MIRYGDQKCHHYFVRRLDGYEEYCIPLICKRCGAYACICDITNTNIEGYNLEKENGVESKNFVPWNKSVKNFIL